VNCRIVSRLRQQLLFFYTSLPTLLAFPKLVDDSNIALAVTEKRLLAVF